MPTVQSITEELVQGVHAASNGSTTTAAAATAVVVVLRRRGLGVGGACSSFAHPFWLGCP